MLKDLVQTSPDVDLPELKTNIFFLILIRVV
jgi:hypothetical protein